MQRYTVYFIWRTALPVSGGNSTHHQERKQLYPQHLVFVTPLLLSAAIVEVLELVSVCCGWSTLRDSVQQLHVQQLHVQQLHVQQLHVQQHSTHAHPEAASFSFRLLMMGGVSPETC
jgi:hypothetical protein